MKRIIVCCVALLCAAPVAASTICAEDDVIAIVLDPTISPTKYTQTADLMEREITFPYGSVWGVAACIDVAGGAAGQIAPENFTDSNGAPVIGGERTGKYCWCQMRHPARSRWVYLKSYGSIASCRGDCTGHYSCGGNVQRNATIQSAVFGSIGK